MVQTLNDIYKLIKSPAYHAQYVPPTPEIRAHTSYDLFNTTAAEHIHIEIHNTFMDIYKYKNMNSEFYANVRMTNKRGLKTMERFKELLFMKTLAAMMKSVEGNYR